MSDSKVVEDLFDTNLWTAPDCNYRELLQKLKQVVNGHGGELNQSQFYLDTRGADSYLRTSSSKGYLSAQQDMPMDASADAIFHHFKRNEYNRESIHIIGLGCGDGMQEIRLVKALMNRLPKVHVYLYLLDISSFLVNTAYHLAKNAFEGNKNITLKQIQGNFESLSTYKPFTKLALQSGQMIVLTMYGYTIGNLPTEQLFIRNALRAFPENTLFLTDVPKCDWSATDPNIIMQKDPRLAGKTDWQNSPEMTEFFQSIWQYREGFKSIKFSQKLDFTTCVPGSYAVVISALVDDEVEFTLFRIKRYTPDGYSKMLYNEGWVSVRGFPYGRSSDPRMLYLAYKR